VRSKRQKRPLRFCLSTYQIFSILRKPKAAVGFRLLIHLTSCGSPIPGCDPHWESLATPFDDKQIFSTKSIWLRQHFQKICFQMFFSLSMVAKLRPTRSTSHSGQPIPR